MGIITTIYNQICQFVNFPTLMKSGTKTLACVYLGNRTKHSHPPRARGSPPASWSYWQSIPCKTPSHHWGQTSRSHLPWHRPLLSARGCLRQHKRHQRQGVNSAGSLVAEKSNTTLQQRRVQGDLSGRGTASSQTKQVMLLVIVWETSHSPDFPLTVLDLIMNLFSQKYLSYVARSRCTFLIISVQTRALLLFSKLRHLPVHINHCCS